MHASESPRGFTYRFTTPSGVVHSYRYELNQPPSANAADLPDWTRLEYQQCKGCSWAASERCPVAVALVEPAKLLGKLVSYEPVSVEVEAPERIYRKETTAQEGLSSLYGLIMATSGCPSFAFLKGMGYYHQPFSSIKETFYRSLSTYVLSGFLRKEVKLEEQALSEITELYDQVKHTNVGITRRLREGAAPESDSPMNAIVILDSFGALVPMSFESGLKELKKIFL